MRTIKHSRFVVVVLTLLFVAGGVGPAGAQTEQGMPQGQPIEPRTALMDSTEEYKASTEYLLRLEETQVKNAAARLEQLRQLFAEGIIAQREIEESEQSLTAAQSKLEATRGQLADAERLIAGIAAAEEAAASQPATSTQSGPVQTGSYSATATLIRYTGRTSWSVMNLSAVQTFFSDRFGRPLPTSAVGQTATHNRLGFDHRHAADVALHPDSPEGRALINYLQAAGIPFLAFRAAVPGASTGAHIHIGRPSHRIA
jgi:hypothetical protein